MPVKRLFNYLAHGQLARYFMARMEHILDQVNRFMGANTFQALTDPTGTYIRGVINTGCRVYGHYGLK